MINDMKFIGLRNIYYRLIKANKCPISKWRIFDKRVSQFKNIHKGESCFVIGNGPSLTVEDLDTIARQGYPTFAANRIFKMFDKTVWRPTYMVFQDHQVIEDIASVFGEISKNCKNMFVRRDVYQQIAPKLRDTEKFVYPRLVMHIRKDKLYDFAEDVGRCAYDGCTVTYLAAQLAYYMGFKKIYLIGVDHNFPLMYDENDNIIINSEVTAQHAFDNKVDNPARVIETTYAYRSARRFLDAHGVEIFNATRGGKLEEFIRKDLDEIFEESK